MDADCAQRYEYSIKELLAYTCPYADGKSVRPIVQILSVGQVFAATYRSSGSFFYGILLETLDAPKTFAQLEASVIATFAKTLSTHTAEELKIAKHQLYQAIAWLHAMHLVKVSDDVCCSKVSHGDAKTYSYACCYERTSLGDGAVKLLKMKRAALEAAEFFLAFSAEQTWSGPVVSSKYISEEEERLNAVLAGHAEWLDKAWFDNNVAWPMVADLPCSIRFHEVLLDDWLCVRVWRSWIYDVRSGNVQVC